MWPFLWLKNSTPSVKKNTILDLNLDNSKPLVVRKFLPFRLFFQPKIPLAAPYSCCRQHCSFPAASRWTLALSAAAAVNSKAARFGGGLSFFLPAPQPLRPCPECPAVPLASPARTQHRCSPSPQSRRITRPALSPFPAPATGCDERLDRSVQLCCA